MNINITYHHCDDPTGALSAYAKEKLTKLSRYDNEISDIHVTLEVENAHRTQRVKISIKRPGNEFQAEAEANQELNEDMYAAIDKVIDKLSMQISKAKEKRHAHR